MGERKARDPRGARNPRKALISASLAAADQAALGAAAEELSRHVDLIHIDLEDGSFSPNLTVGPFVVRDLRPHSRLPFEVHLMLRHPEDHLPEVALAGADIIVVNVEACPYPLRTIRLIRSLGKRAGLAFNWGTPLGALPYLAGELDCLLLLTSEPDLEGQKYIEGAPARVAEAKRLLGAAPVAIIVDGGVGEANAAALADQGATEFVVGRYLWRGGDVANNVSRLRTVLED
ncbi:MAG TPA: ribulose-phosphate 3-epimerase [Bacillota bacterium]